MIYKLFVNGVEYEDFKTLKDINKYLFEHGIDGKKFNLEVKIIKKVKKKNKRR